MFGIGLQELIVIMVVALIVLGPQRLPEVAKSLGKFYREIKGSLDEVKSSIGQDISSIKSIQSEPVVKEQSLTEKKSLTFEEEFENEIKHRTVPKDEVKREKVSFQKDSRELSKEV